MSSNHVRYFYRPCQNILVSLSISADTNADIIEILNEWTLNERTWFCQKVLTLFELLRASNLLLCFDGQIGFSSFILNARQTDDRRTDIQHCKRSKTCVS